MDEKDIEIHVLKVALDNHWTLQPNQKKLHSLIKVMAKKSRGKTVICPCKAFVEGFVDPADVACPCAEAQHDINEQGVCHCGMFVGIYD